MFQNIPQNYLRGILLGMMGVWGEIPVFQFYFQYNEHVKHYIKIPLGWNFGTY